MIREVILVDDASTKEALKKPLENYLRQQKLSSIVKIVRSQYVLN